MPRQRSLVVAHTHTQYIYSAAANMISRRTSMCLLAASGIASAFVPPQAFTQVARPEQQALSSSSHVALSGTPLGLNAMHVRGSACRSPSPLFPPQAHLLRSVLCERQELLLCCCAGCTFPVHQFFQIFISLCFSVSSQNQPQSLRHPTRAPDLSQARSRYIRHSYCCT